MAGGAIVHNKGTKLFSPDFRGSKAQILQRMLYSSRMNWDTQLSSFLSSTDGSVAKMKERLTSPGKFSRGREDLFHVREVVAGSSLDPAHPLPPRTQQPSSSLCPAVQWEDLTTIQSQVQIQSQVMESLTQKLHDIHIERQSQQRLIQILQEEVHRLREESKERQREEERSRQCPETERQMERWRQEVGRELSSLRGQISRATSLGNPEESFSSKLRREELEQLRREVDQLKTRLRRQEEDVFVQQSEGRESRRQYERSCKMLEELTDGYRTHCLDVAKTVSQYTHTQQEVHQIRATVAQLKDEVRDLVLGDQHQPTPLISQRTSAMFPAADPVPIPSSHNKGVKVQEEEPDSDSEDFSPTPSLAEVSSDDLSWLEDDVDIAPHQKDVLHVRLSTKSRQSGIAGPSSDLDDNDHDNDDDDDDDDDLLDEGNQQLGADLSFNDL